MTGWKRITTLFRASPEYLKRTSPNASGYHNTPIQKLIYPAEPINRVARTCCYLLTGCHERYEHINFLDIAPFIAILSGQ